MTWTPKSLDSLAEFLLEEAGVVSPPVNIERLALRLGVDRIVTDPLQEDVGRLAWLDSGLVISANPSIGPARRRFTIAHEVAHLVLADPRFDLRPLRTSQGLHSDERFCDRLAESLLMPATWLAGRYGDRAQELDALMSCARLFRVSAAAAMVRLQRIAGWSRSLLRFQVVRGDWSLLSVTAWKPEPRTCVRSNAATRAVLETFAVPNTQSRLWLPLSVQGEDRAFGAELRASEWGVFALVDPALRRSLDGRGGHSGAKERFPAGLKLFYSLDDLDACILSFSTEPEGSDEGRSNREEATVSAVGG